MRPKVKILVFLAVVVVIFGAVKTIYERSLMEYFPLKYRQEIKESSREHDLSEYLVMAVINTESGFDKDAHSGIAKGLMQITDDTAKWIAEKMGIEYYDDMTYDPETNIKMGCFYLRYLIDKYQNTETALAAYNAGMGTVNGWLLEKRYSEDGVALQNIPYPETEKYVARVQLSKKVYQKVY